MDHDESPREDDNNFSSRFTAPGKSKKQNSGVSRAWSGVVGSEENYKYQVELPAVGEEVAWKWNELNEKQLKAALIGACKRMPRNAEAHFHLGLMYMRMCNGEEALRSFQHCKQIYEERMETFKRLGREVPKACRAMVAKLKSHTAQAAHLAASMKVKKDQRAPLLEKLQKDLVGATNLDNTQPDTWNALALLHLTEGGHLGAREVLRCICKSFPEYLDTLNNLGLAELALGNEASAMACFQNVILRDRFHAEALSNYGVILLRRGMFNGALRAFEDAVRGSASEGRGLSFAWGGLAVARLAICQFEKAEAAALEAERTADPVNKYRFSMLATSIRARKLSHDLRCGRADGSQGAQQCNLDDPRADIDQIVLKLRPSTRWLDTAASRTCLGAALRLRHEYSWDESGHRNCGAEVAERFVEALEKDENDCSAWVQLSLLQMDTGEYASARDFSIQAVSRAAGLEAAWNALAVASQLSDDTVHSSKAYEKALNATVTNYNKRRGDLSADGKASKDEEEREQAASDLYSDPVPPELLNAAGQAALSCIWNNIGNLRRQEGGSFSDALEAYKLSLRYGGENPDVYNNLGVLYISAGRLEEAKEMLEHSLKLEPGFEFAISNLMKLEKLMGSQCRDSGSESLKRKAPT